MDMGLQKIRKAQFVEAREKISDAADLYQSIQEWRKYVLCRKELAATHTKNGRFKEAETDGRELVEFCQKTFGENHILTLISKSFVGEVLFAQGYYDKGGGIFQECLKTYKICSERDVSFEAKTYSNIGVYYIFLGLTEKALSFVEKSLALNEKADKKDTDRMVRNYCNVGMLYKMLGNAEMAISYHYKALAIQEQTGDAHVMRKADIFIGLGQLFLDLEQFEKARHYFFEALNIHYEIYGKEHRGSTGLYYGIGKFYLAQKNYKESISYFQKAIHILEHSSNIPIYDINWMYIHLGRIYLEQKKYLKAIEHFQKSLLVYHKKSGKRNKCLVEMQHYLSKAFLKTGNLSEALRMNHESLVANTKSLNSFDLVHPTTEQKDQIIHFYQVVNCLVLRIHILYQEFLQTNSIASLKQALDLAHSAESWADIARNSRLNYEDKKNLSITTKELYAVTLNICYTLIERENNAISYLQKAFYFIEKAKSATLISVLTDNKALKYGHLPKILGEEEQELKALIAFNKAQLFEAEFGKKQKKINYYRTQLADNQSAYHKLIQRFEKDYPEYYRLKYDYKIIDLETVQSKLSKHSMLINYYVTEESLYFFVATHQSIDFYRESFSFLLEEKTEAYLNSIYTFWMMRVMQPDKATVDLKKQLEFELGEKSHQLYEALFSPILRKSIEGRNIRPQHIIVIPDDVLWYIPFETLSTKNPLQKQNFRQYDFLLQDYAFSYAYSATILFDGGAGILEGKQPNDTKLLAIAPDFSSTEEKTFSDLRTFRRRGFGILKHSKEEVNKIVGIFKGKKLLAEQATKANFVASVSDYQLVHISTHAKADDENPERSVIAFGREESSMLYAAEIHQLKLNAELLVLSACETGAGKLQKGEGIASIARAFAYAGVKNLCTSLWSVNDQSTASIMQSFYGYLKKGKAKDEALRQAKLDYIKNSPNQLAHPFFWAAFVLIGDCKPVVNTSNWRSWLYSFFSKKR